MRMRVVGWLIAAILVCPVAGYAQEAAVFGVVTDSTGAVLPGVTVMAVHEASGNSFQGVTDERGTYRIPLRIGSYRVSAELAGFATVTRSGLEVLVGQQATVNLQLSPSTVQESVTVTGEAPLIDTTQSRAGGNVDSRQLSELPVQGRNWVDLTMLVPGSRSNSVDETPLPRDTGAFQLNMDGQQVTQSVAYSFGQPRFSRDAVAEFEFITNRFDATQGRSAGVQVNAITKSGTNTYAGTFSGYFRNDRFNAADLVQKRVLPYSNQQFSTMFGGPIRRDRIHFFGNYEYEREPQTFSYSTPWPRFNIDQTGTRTDYKVGGRGDFQFSSATRLSVRVNKYLNKIPLDPRYTGGSTIHPSSAENTDRHSKQIWANFTQVLGSRALNEVKGGFSQFFWVQDNYAKNPNSPTGTGIGAPQINFIGYRVGQVHTNSPGTVGLDDYSIRDDFHYSISRGGRHDLKIGAEFLHQTNWANLCNNCIGVYDAQGGPIPANIEDIFPVWDDVTTWNMAAISPLVRRYTVGIGGGDVTYLRKVFATWLQNDWVITRRLTLNLGVRYDLQAGAIAEKVRLLPFLSGDRPSDTNNVAPRFGFAFTVNDRTVLRGGYGKFFADVTDNLARRTLTSSVEIHPEIANDNRPDFAANPFNGPVPTYEQALALVPRRAIQTMLAPNVQIPWSHQASVGVQRQMGTSLAVEGDYVYNGGRAEPSGGNMNLGYDPVTGINYPFSDFSRRPYPGWGNVSMTVTERRSNSHALQTAFRKTFSQDWQASGTYSLSFLRDDDPLPYSGLEQVTFALQPDLGGQYSLAVTDQRHRAVFNGIWEPGYGFQVSGMYFYGSGLRFNTNFGGDRRNTGGSGSRLRPDGSIVPRNGFVGLPIHRVDLRVQRRFAFGDKVRIDGIVEMFNLFNHENYGSYTIAESNQNYGKPEPSTNVAFAPRMLQLGFRVAF